MLTRTLEGSNATTVDMKFGAHKAGKIFLFIKQKKKVTTCWNFVAYLSFMSAMK